MTLPIEHCPWKMPLSVEESRFTPLLPEHAALNVQVARRGPAALSPDPAHPPLLADLQTPFYGALGGSLGSGRAGFYRGFYLKGVGRTPLTSSREPAAHGAATAGSSAAPSSAHSSHAQPPPGHLSASSAIRELVASIYLEERGGADSIVPCQGVLFAELSPELAAYHAPHHARSPAEHVPPVDLHLQAITVQPGGFARQSNFVWLLHHLAPAHEASAAAGRHSLATFCRLLASSLDPEASAASSACGAESGADVSAEQLVAALERTTLAALSRFRLWFQRGVWWGAFHNHFTIDGRFLDLETPALLGGPCLGRLSTASGGPARPVHSTVIGLEQLSFLAQSRAFAFELRRVLRQLPRTFDRAERELAEALATAVEERLLAPHRLLGSREQSLERVLAMVEDAFGTLSAVERTLVRSIVEAGYTSSVGQDGRDPTGRASGTFTPVPDLPYLLTEAGHSWRPCAVALEAGRLLQPSDEQRRTARHFAELLDDLDHTTALPALLDKLGALRSSAPQSSPAHALYAPEQPRA